MSTRFKNGESDLINAEMLERLQQLPERVERIEKQISEDIGGANVSL